MIVIALIEVFAFNMSYWQTRDNTPNSVSLEHACNTTQINTHSAASLCRGSGLSYSSKNHMLTVDNDTGAYLDLVVRQDSVSYLRMNITSAHVSGEDSNNLIVRIDTPSSNTSSSSSESTESGQWSVRATHTINPSVARSLSMRISHDAQAPNHLRIWIQEAAGTNIAISTISINPKIGMHISLLRVAAMLAIYMLLALTLPCSRLWSIPLNTSRKGQRLALALIIAAFVAIGLISVISSIASYSLQQFHNQGGYTYDFNQYAYTADALLHGRPWLDLEVPQAFAHASNPYDVAVRKQLLRHGVSPIYWDYAFFKGHWYSYFGVVPAVLLYLPYQAITSLWVDGGLFLPTPAAMAILITLGMIAAVLLIVRILQRYFAGISLAATLLCIIAMLCASNFPYLTASGMFYTIPFAASLFFTFLGLWFWLGHRKASAATNSLKCSYPRIILGSLCMALNLGCRPTFILAALLAIPIVGGELWQLLRTHHFRQLIAVLASGIIPAIVVFIPLLSYNLWRFGSFTDFGNNYQITVTDMTQYRAPLATLAPIVGYFFALPPNFTSNFPWVDYASVPLDAWQYAEPALGGILVISPILCMAFALPFLHRRLQTRKIWWFSLSMCSLGLVLVLFDSYKAGFAWRYMTDFTWLFSLVAIICAAELLHHSSSPQQADVLPAAALSSTRDTSHIIVASIVFLLVMLTIMMHTLGVLMLWERNDPAMLLSIAQWFIR